MFFVVIVVVAVVIVIISYLLKFGSVIAEIQAGAELGQAQVKLGFDFT